MKKAFDQTVRDLKREVNKKVLKVPGIEQKVLDATSNEPWGPHGSHLAEIAQATRNYHEYQLIMAVIWKRINDTGKNWRHVYKGLTALEYLVAHGSERVIDDIKEHAYQISTLSDFQYIDSKGRDQGNNVRKKSQSLVALVNDKERIQEVREKALANKDKYRSTFSTSGSHRPGGGGYGDRYDDDRYEGRYGGRDDNRNGYGRERDGGYRDDDHYGDRYGRDSDERYNREGYRDDDYRGRGREDDYKFGPRSRSVDRDRDRSFDDDDRYSSRSGGGRVDEPSQEPRPLERKLSEPNFGGPPSYEEAVKNTHDITDDRDGRTSTVTPAPLPPEPKVSHSETTNVNLSAAATASSMPSYNEADTFDEFDPRSSAFVAPTGPATANSMEVDLFGGLSTEDSINSLALVPVTSVSTTSESDVPTSSGFRNDFVALSSASSVLNQPSQNPFGDAPFMAIPQDNFVAQPPNNVPPVSFQPAFGSAGGSEPQPAAAPKGENGSGFDFGESFHGITYAPSTVPNGQPASTLGFPPSETLAAQPSNADLGGLFAQSGPAAYPSQPPQSAALPRTQTAPPEFFARPALSVPVASQAAPTNYYAQPGQFLQGPAPNNLTSAGLAPSAAPLSLLGTPMTSQVVSSTTSQTAIKPSQSKDKFETKSAVWADTINRGLVNLNISGPKINPLADIGIDFDSINRKEKREKEKSSSASTSSISTVSMGKAMGSGSGIGRVGATGLPPPPNPMMGSGMGMGGGGMGMGMGMGAYGGMNQPMGMGMNMGMAPMGMGMGQGMAMRPNGSMPPGPGMPGVGYNPMMGMGGYGAQPYGGGYR